MHKTLKKIENKRFADLIENIIKKQTEASILQNFIDEKSNIKLKELKSTKVIYKLNKLIWDMDFTEVPFGEHAGKPPIQIVTIKGKYNALKYFVEKKLFKKKIKVDSKTLDAIFYLNTYNYALICYNDKIARKDLKIKKGLFG
jgi:hypothetical protein